MKVKLQERHLCFVTQHLSNIVAGQYFKLLSEIKSGIYIYINYNIEMGYLMLILMI